MQTDEHRAVLRIGQGGTVIERRIFIAAARLQDLEALRFEGAANLKGQVEDQIAFANALRTAGAGVGAAVGGVEHDDAEPGSLRLRWRNRGVRRSQNRRGGLLRGRRSGRRGLWRLRS